MTSPHLRLHYSAISDVGRVRKDNQDSGYAGAWLLAVCDGVGGAARAAAGGGKPAKQKKKPPSRRGSPTQVVVTSGTNDGATAALADAPILIGRGPDAAIRLEDDYVSTRHARIAASGDQWFVEDLGSTNGTYIGTVRITQPTTITLGTQVRIGKTILELRK